MKIFNVPLINGLNKTKGCEKAGEQVFDVLKEEIYSNESGDFFDDNSFELENISFDKEDLEKAEEQIYNSSFEIYKNQNKSVFFGGDHSVSYPLTKAFFDFTENSGRESCLIVFDAHPDCMPPMKEPTHEEWLRKLVEDGFPAKNVLLVGNRNSHKKELDFIKEKKIKRVNMNALLLDLENICDTIMEFSNGKDLYVSIDIDVVDPAFAPGTGYPESGGLSSREFLYIVQRINKIKNLKAVDIVEINPDKDLNKKTIKLGAKILSELI